MTKLNSILKNLITQNKINESELARRTGVTQQVINQIISGKNTNPKLDTLKKIATYFLITISQLIGDEPISSQNIKVNQEHYGWNEIPILSIDKVFDDSIENLIKNKESVLLSDLISNDTLFAINLDDDSMEPKFSVNSILVFKIQHSANNGEFILIADENIKAIKFRQVCIRQNEIFVRCINPTHQDYQLKKLDSFCKILGILVQARVDFNRS